MTRRNAFATLTATLATGLVVVPAVADGTIVVQKSIAGITLGMTQDEVKAVLGEPDEVNRPSNEIFGSYTEFRYGLTYVSLFAGEDGEVFSVSTTSKKQRTSKDVGVGTSEKVLKQRVKGVKCQSYGTSFRICTVGRGNPGEVVTDFRIGRKSRRVARVSIGRVID